MQHLIIDGYTENKAILQDDQYIYNLLDKYPSEIGMTRIQGPVVFRYNGLKPEDWGISGLVFIAESHISIHTFVERQYMNIDVFSCLPFDADRAINDFKERFDLKKMRCCTINRDWDIAALDSEHKIHQLNMAWTR